jgi:hypothetical protein
MAIDRAPFNALVDDDGSNLVGSIWNKAAIAAVILDPADAAFSVTTGTFTPVDVSGAGIVFTVASGNYARYGKIMVVTLQVVYPSTASGALAAIGGLPATVAGPTGGAGVSGYGVARMWALPAGSNTIQPFNPTTAAQQTNAQMSGANVIASATYISQ